MNNLYHIDDIDIQIVLDALKLLYNQMHMHEQLNIATPYSQADIEMLIEALKNSKNYYYKKN